MQILTDALDRDPSGVVSPIRWPAFKAELNAIYSPPAVAKATASKLRGVLAELDRLGVQTTADLAPVLVSRYIAMRPPEQSTHTLHSLLTVIRTVCHYAETAGYLRCSPFRLRKLSRWVRLAPLEGRRHHGRNEIKKVLELLAQDIADCTGWKQWRARRLYVLASIVAYCGLRKNEALKLHVSDIDMARKVIWVRAHDGGRLKTVASEAPVPMPEALIPIIAAWLPHLMDAPFGYPLPAECPWLIPTISRKGPWTGGPPGGKALDRLKAAGMRAGVPGFTFLSLRHSLATHLEHQGLGPAAIGRILRHTTARTAEKHYRHADVPNMVAQTASFDF